MTIKQGFIILCITALLSALACSKAPKQPATSVPFDRAAYTESLQKWQADRAASLMKEDGWLSLVGLFWLKEGENKFGSGTTNEVVFPKGKAPQVAGSFWLKEGKVRLTAVPAAKISIVNAPDKSGSEPVTAADLKADADEGGPTVLRLGSIRFNVVKRIDRFGIRVKDSESPTRREFKGLEYYDIDPKWRIEARVEPYNPEKKIPITNVLGMTEDETSPGALAFEIDGKTYRLDPILEQGETDWFVMIADETTGKETYGAGRYLYVTPPGADGKVIIDFNKAYSPPCAFTSFATCPLPPRQNHLPLRIDAGEKKYAGTVH
jgi:uncharacterized protein